MKNKKDKIFDYYDQLAPLLESSGRTLETATLKLVEELGEFVSAKFGLDSYKKKTVAELQEEVVDLLQCAMSVYSLVQTRFPFDGAKLMKEKLDKWAKVYPPLTDEQRMERRLLEPIVIDSPTAAKKLIRMLENPPKPNKKLKKLMNNDKYHVCTPEEAKKNAEEWMLDESIYPAFDKKLWETKKVNKNDKEWNLGEACLNIDKLLSKSRKNKKRRK